MIEYMKKLSPEQLRAFIGPSICSLLNRAVDRFLDIHLTRQTEERFDAWIAHLEGGPPPPKPWYGRSTQDHFGSLFEKWER